MEADNEFDTYYKAVAKAIYKSIDKKTLKYTNTSLEDIENMILNFNEQWDMIDKNVGDFYENNESKKKAYDYLIDIIQQYLVGQMSVM